MGENVTQPLAKNRGGLRFETRSLIALFGVKFRVRFRYLTITSTTGSSSNQSLTLDDDIGQALAALPTKKT